MAARATTARLRAPDPPRSWRVIRAGAPTTRHDPPGGSARRLPGRRAGALALLGARGLLERLAPEHLLEGDGALRARAPEEADDPVEQRREAVLEAGQEGQVNDEPQQPA